MQCDVTTSQEIQEMEFPSAATTTNINKSDTDPPPDAMQVLSN